MLQIIIDAHNYNIWWHTSTMPTLSCRYGLYKESNTFLDLINIQSGFKNCVSGFFVFNISKTAGPNGLPFSTLFWFFRKITLPLYFFYLRFTFFKFWIEAFYGPLVLYQLHGKKRNDLVYVQAQHHENKLKGRSTQDNSLLVVV